MNFPEKYVKIIAEFYILKNGDNTMKIFFALIFALLFIFCSCGEISTGNPAESETVATDTEAETTLPVTEVETEATKETEEETTTKSDPTQIVAPQELFVTINEVCSSNNGNFLDSTGDTPDWIELYNSSDSAVNLAGYTISNDTENPRKYVFSNYLIEAGSYVLLMATGNVGYKNGVISLPFKLSAEGEELVLTSPDGLRDELKVPMLEADETYGRTNDGGGTLNYLTPSPLATNNTATSIIKVPAPAFSHVSGFYSTPIELKINIPDGYTVYYTTDGSTPTQSSSIYSEPLYLEDATEKPNVYSAIGGNTVSDFITKNNQNKANVIRAVAYDSDGNASKAVGGTFFITRILQEDSYKNMPILSVYTDGENLFDYETGIYVLGKTYDDYMNNPENAPYKETWARPANYFLDGIESERPASIEYFDAQHNFCFYQDVGIRMAGNTSQSSQQKSMKFYARSEYGKNSFDYPIFEGVEFYDTFLMRTGANDFAKTKIRDVLNQSLVAHRDVTTSKWQPCVMFLNGEYWGFYMMMERYDADYFEQYYGVDKDNVIAIKTGNVDIGNDDDKDLYRELRNFCKNNDLTIPENYEKLCSMIDMQSYIDYVCFNVIANNADWPGNNTELWRVRETDPSNPYADGKWRWVVYDTERTMLLYGTDSNEDYDVNTYTRKLIDNGIIFGYVYKNEDFKNHFVTTLMDIFMKDYDTSKINEHLDYFEENFNEQMKMNRLRYNTTSDYPKELDVIRTFWEHRGEYLLKYTCELFELENKVTEFSVRTEGGEGSEIYLYDYLLPLEGGRYASEYLPAKIELTAKAAEGYRLAGWKDLGGNIIGTEDTVTVSPDVTSAITAVFEKIQ